MKQRIFNILAVLLFLSITTMEARIGDWKAYMAYSEVQEIEQAGNLIFVQASNTSMSITKTTRVSRLSARWIT